MDPDPDSDPVIFVIDLQDANKTLILVFCLLLFEGTFTSFFKDKKSKRINKTVGIKFFFTILLDDRRTRIPKTNGYDGSGPATQKAAQKFFQNSTARRLFLA
jgi:hypothetical protein